MSLSKPIFLLRIGVRRFATHNNASLPIKNITVRPSLRPYGELQVISPGKFRIPKKPFSMTVQYIDSSPTERKKQTVLAIHGCPGNCQHFEALANDFYQHPEENIRFISVSLPDFRHTRENGYFWNTTPERVNFVRQFLSDLNIDSIDCIVNHSLGVHTSVALCDNPEDLKIRSMCTFAPNPFWDTAGLSEAERAKKLLVFRNRIWLNFVNMINARRFYSPPVSMKNTDEMLTFVSILNDDMRKGFEDRLRRVVQNPELPVSLIYGSREKLISEKSIARFYSVLGEEIMNLDPTVKDFEKVIDSDKRINSYMLQDGGHMLHLKYHGLAKRMIMNLLKRVEPSQL